MTDIVNKPKHYFGDNGLEVEQILREFTPRIDDAYVAHRVASAIEYILRAPLKNGLEDYKKARKNLEQAIEYIEGKVLNNEVIEVGDKVFYLGEGYYVCHYYRCSDDYLISKESINIGNWDISLPNTIVVLPEDLKLIEKGDYKNE